MRILSIVFEVLLLAPALFGFERHIKAAEPCSGRDVRLLPHALYLRMRLKKDAQDRRDGER